MKCLRNTETGKIDRVSDVKAMRLVIDGPWSYEKKSAWKAQQRAGAANEKTNE